MSPTILLVVLLGIASASAGLLGKLYVGAKEDLGRQEQATAEARAAATLCSQETERLAAEGEKRAKAAASAIAAARKSEAKAHTHALTVLATAPAVPGDACKSTDLLNQAEIAARKAAGASGAVKP